jgi:transcriptional regulator of acetoin/glycerol metabolism
MQLEESTVLALKGPDPFASCDQAGARSEYEQILGCNPTLKVALPELERAAPTDPTARVVRGTATQFQGRTSGRSIRIPFNSGHPERHREFGRIVGSSRALESALALVERVAPTQSAVLVLGETGSGKELIARAIHNRSPRYDRALLCLEEKAFSRLSSGFEPTGH